MNKDLRTILLFIEKEDIEYDNITVFDYTHTKKVNWTVRLTKLILRQLTQAGVYPSNQFNVEFHITDITDITDNKNCITGTVNYDVDELTGIGPLNITKIEYEELQKIKSIIEDCNEYRIADYEALQSIKKIILE